MKPIKRNLFLPGTLILLLSLLLYSSCEKIEVGNDFLAQPPELDYSLDSVFASSERAKEILWNAYSTLPWGLGIQTGSEIPVGTGTFPLWNLTDLTMDNVSWANIQAWRDGNVSATDVDNFGNEFGPAKYDWELTLGYRGIRSCFIFIDNIDRVPDMEESEKMKLKAEANMIIATHYVEMFLHYGGILYVNHAYRPDEETNLERLTILQTVDTLSNIIDNAVPHLPLELDNPELWSGRFTSVGAMALKVKLLTFAASPLFNSDEPFMPQSHEAVSRQLVWTGGYRRELWERARDAAREVITLIESSSYYRMVNTGDPRADYTRAYFERGTGETLLSFRKMDQVVQPFHTDKPGFWGQDYFSSGAGPKLLPKHNWVMKFPMRNGKAITDPTSGYDPENPYADRDPRLYECIVVNGDLPWNDRKAELWVGGRDRKVLRGNHRDLTGYIQRKWILDHRATLNRYTHWPYIRIPEIYLAYAEALNELNNGPTEQAFEYVNKVRERVGVGPVEDFIGKPKSEITKEEFVEALLNERAIELGCEDQRWFDMVRYKRQDVFETPNYAMDVFLNEDAESMTDFSEFFQENVEFTDHHLYFDYEVVELDIGTFDWMTNFSPKYYLEPLPFKEVQKGYGLVQNPGWEL